MEKVRPPGNREKDSLMERAWAIVVAVLVGMAYLAPDVALYDVWCGLTALVVLPFALIPLETIVAVLQDTPASIPLLGLFCLATLLLGLAELEG
jgi:hypothetical protein